MIRNLFKHCSVILSDKSAEERAAYREIALKQAEYIAEKYLDNEQEATSFMNEINIMKMMCYEKKDTLSLITVT